MAVLLLLQSSSASRFTADAPPPAPVIREKSRNFVLKMIRCH
jgi:hypothetical protein